MSRENFLDILKTRYVEDIREAYLECEHGADRPIDSAKLDRLLLRLMLQAMKAGLTRDEFEELAMASLPGIPVHLAAATPIAPVSSQRLLEKKAA
jgi:hypothetical protein